MMLIYIISALYKGNNSYIGTELVELLLLINYDVINVISNDAMLLLYLLGFPVLFNNIAVI